MTTGATSPLRMWGYCLVLTAVAFVQEPGRIVGDTKFDLVVDPAGFLARATHLWDPAAAFGQMQNQAYGYFWPMGPFFLLGDVAGLEPWVVQRLWWALLLCLAFVGVVKVARALDLGSPWTRVVAGFAFALSAHVLTLIGPTSVEAWPSSLAPWVLLPLVHASREGSVRRGAALSALAVAMCGGVNAVAVSAVLPLGVLWIATRERGPRRLRLFGWWVLFTALATLWWVVPLLLLGRYSVPFLDYIENAPITTLPTSLPDVLGGTSDWVAYSGSVDWAAGNLLGTTPVLLVNAAVVAGVGLAGIARPDNEHRHFLLLGVLVGVLLVTFGYTGPLHGWWAEQRLDLLDAELAPLRNLHKYDVVLRLPLVLGLAHFLDVVARSARSAPQRLPHRMLVLATVVSVVGVAAPAYAGRLAPSGSFEQVPDYWRQAAGYLAEHQGDGVALEIPASPFGDYGWGSPHDDVMQPLASRPWAVRNVIPLAQPGNVRLLDAVTRTVELGRPSATLARALAASGVSHLVVRNDLHPQRSGAPDRVLLHQALDRSPGLTKVAEFGPMLGEEAVFRAENGVRVVRDRGRQAPFAAVEVYSVSGTPGPVTAWEADSVPVLSGGPDAVLANDADVLSGPSVLAGDRPPGLTLGPTVLTDGLRRREVAFTEVRQNESATMTPDEPWRLSSVVPNHRIYDDQSRFETQASFVGVRSVEASTAQSHADAPPPLRPEHLPSAAMDGRRTTQWVSAGRSGAVGEWWKVRFEEPVVVEEVTLRGARPVGAPVTRLRIRTSGGAVAVTAPDRGELVTYQLPREETSFLKIEALRVEGGGQGQFALAEVKVPGVAAERFLTLPDVLGSAPRDILLRREPGRPACAVVERTNVCDDFWRTQGEEKHALRRELPLRQPESYRVDMTASLRPWRPAWERVAAALPVQVRTSRPLSRDVAASGLAAVDGDPSTAWVAAPVTGEPQLSLRWDKPVAIDAIDLDVLPSTPGARPRTVLLRAGRQTRLLQLEQGTGTFDELVTDRVRIRFLATEPVYSFEGARALRLPVAVGEVSFPFSGVPVVDADRSLDLGCGSGPALSVNGREVESRVVASLSELMSGEELPVSWCGEGRVSLSAGMNRMRVLPSALSRVEGVQLGPTETAAGPSLEPVDAAVVTWESSRRSVALEGRTEPVLLVVSENFNPGWVARLAGSSLDSQRVDGWKQGWVVPAGAAAVVTMEFEPDGTFRAALLLGALTVLLVVLAAVWPARRRHHGTGGGTSTASGALLAGLSVIAGGLVAGWPGVAGMAVAATLGRTVRARNNVGILAGVAVVAAGAVHAAARADGFQMHAHTAQSLALASLVLAVAAVTTLGAKGPEFFRRRKGRSSR